MFESGGHGLSVDLRIIGMIDIAQIVSQFGEQPVWNVKMPPSTRVADGFEVYDAAKFEAVIDR